MANTENLVFGQNLRKLIAKQGSISSAARGLDISRVQLMRYISGASFPKPFQLAQICRRFGVDGRIFLQPLEDIRLLESEPKAIETPDILRELGLERYTAQTLPIVQGIHMLYRPALVLADRFVAAPLLFRRRHGVTLVRGFDGPPETVQRRNLGGFAARGFQGLALGSEDGMIIHFFGTGRFPFLTTAHFASLGFLSATGGMRGTYELYRAPSSLEKRRVPCILMTLQQKPNIVLNACRKSGTVRLNEIPERFHSYLTSALPD